MTPPQIRIPTDPLLECPTCGLPAEIIDRFTLGGAPELVEHVKLLCVNRHWYTLPVDDPAVAGPGRPQLLVRNAREQG
jgi:hypothetical protein